MNMNDKRILFSGFWFLAGLALVIAGLAGRADSFWTGMGGGLIGVSAMQLIRWMRCRRDADYRERFDTETHDERNQYLSRRAMASAASCFALVGAAAVVVLKILGREQMMLGVSLSVGLLLVLYCIFYFVLRAKN